MDMGVVVVMRVDVVGQTVMMMFVVMFMRVIVMVVMMKMVMFVFVHSQSPFWEKFIGKGLSHCDKPFKHVFVG